LLGHPSEMLFSRILREGIFQSAATPDCAD
jgi:hypothetical protein